MRLLESQLRILRSKGCFEEYRPFFYITYTRGQKGEGRVGTGALQEVDIRVWSQASKVSFEGGLAVSSLVSTCIRWAF
jgi:hypothetical protein